MSRTAAALGMDGIILGRGSCDPYWRRSVRVSMGSIFHMPITLNADIDAVLASLAEDHGFQLIAAVTDVDAEMIGNVPKDHHRLAVLVGPEDEGLDRAHVARCHRKVQIPMHAGIDSLNVSIAAAIVIWEMSGKGTLD